MKTYISTLAALFLAAQVNAESIGEKRWRLRAEILERELELARMELTEKNETATNTALTADPVDAQGTRLASFPTEGVQMATMIQGRSNAMVSDPADSAKTKKVDEPAAVTPAATPAPPPDDANPWPDRWEWVSGYQILKPSTRIYFDTGSDETGEVDLFTDGNLGVAVDFLTISFDYGITDNLSIGTFMAGGISTTTSAADHSAILMLSGGIAIGIRDMPFSFEAGILHGVSASETLSDRTDTALFVGISLNNPVPKKRIGGSILRPKGGSR